MGTTLDRETILRAIQGWPESERVELLRAFLQLEQTMGHFTKLSDLQFLYQGAKGLTPQPPKVLSSRIHGIAALEGAIYSDEEDQRILADELMKKYGN